jgi:hypothetical protein
VFAEQKRVRERGGEKREREGEGEREEKRKRELGKRKEIT